MGARIVRTVVGMLFAVTGLVCLVSVVCRGEGGQGESAPLSLPRAASPAQSTPRTPAAPRGGSSAGKNPSASGGGGQGLPFYAGDLVGRGRNLPIYTGDLPFGGAAPGSGLPARGGDTPFDASRDPAGGAPAARPPKEEFSTDPTGKYNILYIVADDLNTALGCYGHPMVKTPNLDRLASRGLLFENAYCQFSNCNGSRVSFLTGIRPTDHGILNNSTPLRDKLPDAITLPQYFKGGGYYTGRVGKIFHVDVPRGLGESGLDDELSWDKTVNPKGRDVTDQDQITTADGYKKYGSTLGWLAAEGSDSEQTDGQATEAAIEFLRANKEKTFLLAVGYHRPHVPLVAPKKYFDMYPLDKIELARAPLDDWTDIPTLGKNHFLHNRGMNEQTQRQAVRAYYAAVSFLDAQVGELLEALDRTGLASKTIVVFHSDHGFHLGEHHFWQAESLFEEGVRVPLIVSVPNQTSAGKTCQKIVELLDVFPTLCDLCEYEPPDQCVGKSLRPLLENPTVHWTKPAVSQVIRPGPKNLEPSIGISIRTDRYRMTLWDSGELGRELYDRKADPHEFVNQSRSLVYLPMINDLGDTLRLIVENKWEESEPPPADAAEKKPDPKAPSLTKDLKPDVAGGTKSSGPATAKSPKPEPPRPISSDLLPSKDDKPLPPKTEKPQGPGDDKPQPPKPEKPPAPPADPPPPKPEPAPPKSDKKPSLLDDLKP